MNVLELGDEVDALQVLISAALSEDIGERDVTGEAVVDADAFALATITLKESGVVFGLVIAGSVIEICDPNTELELLIDDGTKQLAGTPVLRARGRAQGLLKAERTALNFLAHLSGIASATERIAAIARQGAGAPTVLDTRKTTPGMRRLEKEAVRAGGGQNHRSGLFDVILIKENHIALAGGIARAIERAREVNSAKTITVEVRCADEIDQALEANADRLLLDNMKPCAVREAVAQVRGRAELEASGGIAAENIADYAAIVGLDYISIGALTHSAHALDYSMTMEVSPP